MICGFVDEGQRGVFVPTAARALLGVSLHPAELKRDSLCGYGCFKADAVGQSKDLVNPRNEEL